MTDEITVKLFRAESGAFGGKVTYPSGGQGVFVEDSWKKVLENIMEWIEDTPPQPPIGS